MQIPFEQWILTKNISNGVKQFMEEAFTCYKVSAYRASLFSSISEIASTCNLLWQPRL
jgi:hypothetical protein